MNETAREGRGVLVVAFKTKSNCSRRLSRGEVRACVNGIHLDTSRWLFVDCMLLTGLFYAEKRLLASDYSEL